jgi:hypothetical protein
MRYLVASLVLLVLGVVVVGVVGYVRSRSNGGFPTHESSLDTFSRRRRKAGEPAPGLPPEPDSGPVQFDLRTPPLAPRTERDSGPVSIDLRQDGADRPASPATEPVPVGRAGRSRDGERTGTVEVPAAPDDDGAGDETGVTAAGLPRRRRGVTAGDITSRPAATLRADRSTQAPAAERSPEELRAMLARYQQRSRSARTEAPVERVNGSDDRR